MFFKPGKAYKVLSSMIYYGENNEYLDKAQILLVLSAKEEITEFLSHYESVQFIIADNQVHYMEIIPEFCEYHFQEI